MKKILIPTDFSPAAENAFRFAQAMAEAQGMTLKVAHVYHPEIDPAYPYLANSITDLAAVKSDQLDEFVKRNGQEDDDSVATRVKIEKEVSIGYATEEIVRLSKAEEIDMIVMGTVGQNSMLNKLFGSISSFVARRAHCPCLLIPEEVTFKRFSNVVYASNYQAADEILLKQFLDFSQLYEANVHFVHVDEHLGDDYEVKAVKYEQIVRKNAPDLGFRMVSIGSSNIIEGLNNYVREKDIDLVVMATSPRGFIENLFHKSITKRMALYSEVPLLVMHYDDTKI